MVEETPRLSSESGIKSQLTLCLAAMHNAWHGTEESSIGIFGLPARIRSQGRQETREEPVPRAPSGDRKESREKHDGTKEESEEQCNETESRPDTYTVVLVFGCCGIVCGLWRMAS